MSVSYLVTLYNKEEFIGSVIDAVLAECAETGGEVIVYDDASADRSPQILKERIAAHPAAGFARVIRDETNKGVGYATNHLVNIASQPYTRFIDADDLPVRGSTAHLLRLLKQHRLGFIYGLGTEKGRNDTGLEHQAYAECLRLSDPLHMTLNRLLAGPTQCVIVTDELRKVFPLPEGIRRTQDFVINLRLANRGTPIGYVRDIVRVGPAAVTGNNVSTAVAAMYAEICRDVAHDGPDLPLPGLRYASRRYAARAAKYFRRRGRGKIGAGEKFTLWRWRIFGRCASRRACIDRLNRIAGLLDRDRDVLVLD